jgi:hypothetical protein
LKPVLNSERIFNQYAVLSGTNSPIDSGAVKQHHKEIIPAVYGNYIFENNKIEQE